MSAKKKSSAPKTTQADRAAALGVSVRTLREWERAGISQTEMVDRANRQRERAGASGSMTEVRLRKLTAEAELRELELSRLRGEVISFREVEEAVVRIGAAVRAAVTRLEADLPQALEGLDAPAMQRTIRAAVDLILADLSERGGELTEAK
jgi:transcriptional regulator with XRE-family HTH domain